MVIAASPKPGAVPYATQSAEPGPLPRIWARIPGTAAYKRRKNKIVAEYENDLLKNLRKIFPVVSGETPRIRPTDEGLKSLFITEAARFQFRNEDIRNWLLSISLACGPAMTLVGSIIAKRMWHIHQHWTVWLWAISAALVMLLACLSCWILGLPIYENFFESWSPVATKMFFVFAPPTLFVFVCLIAVHHLRLVSAYAALTFALSVGVFELSLFMASTVGGLMVGLFLVRASYRQAWEGQPVMYVFRGLLDLFPLKVSGFQDPYGTAKFLSGLERVAYLMEGPLVRRLRPGDPFTQSWLEEEMKGRAAAIRELKKIAIYSGGVIPNQLKVNLETTLMHVCNLNWELLDKAPVAVMGKRERALRFSQRLLNATTASVVPASVLIARLFVPAIQQFDKTNLVLVGAIVWLCINLLSVFDPGYGLTKQGLNLLEKIPGMGGKGGDTPSGTEH